MLMILIILLLISLRLYADDTTQYASDVSPILRSEVQNSPGNELGWRSILGLFWGTQAIRSDEQIMEALSHPSIKLNKDDIPGAKLSKPTESVDPSLD